jgi:hypothetical protein
VTGVRFVSYADRPELRLLTGPIDDSWPPFMLEDPVAAACWEAFHDRHPDFQLFGVEEGTGEVVVKVNAVPTAIDGQRLPDRGWDEAVERSLVDEQATVVSALQINIRPDRRSAGLSAVALAEMRRIAADHGFAELVAPVRPTWKPRYPLTPIERYARWVRDDGLPFDPWLRVHVRAGGVIDGVCHRAMTVPGSVAEWEGWTGLQFPDSGRYVVDGALVPDEIDVEADRGVYVEPGVWVRHALDGSLPGS